MADTPHRTDIDQVPAEHVIPVADGAEHGYIGYTPDSAPNEAYTVAGVTGAGTAHVDDQPPPGPAASTRAKTAAVKSTSQKAGS